jgi:hypothetical protein
VISSSRVCESFVCTCCCCAHSFFIVIGLSSGIPSVSGGVMGFRMGLVFGSDLDGGVWRFCVCYFFGFRVPHGLHGCELASALEFKRCYWIGLRIYLPDTNRKHSRM